MKEIRFAKLKKALKGKGFLVALLVSVSAVGIATYIAYDQAVGKIIDEPSITTPSVSVFPDEGEPAANDKNDVPKETDSENANVFVDGEPTLFMPIKDAEIINVFSNGELVKSLTLDMWKTHDGIDLGADVGTEVNSMSSGKVIKVYEDALWGICVEIDHGDGIVSCYYGLSEDVPVSVDAEVEAGAVIGTLGNTAQVESAEKPHIHFGIRKNGQWIDPEKYINA